MEHAEAMIFRDSKVMLQYISPTISDISGKLVNYVLLNIVYCKHSHGT